MSTEYIEAVKNYFDNEKDYVFHIGEEHEKLFANLMLDKCNHIRIYLRDSIETNSVFTDVDFLLKLNKYLYRPDFYVDIITTLGEETKSPTLNGLVVLAHHPAYKQERLNIYDGSDVQIDGAADCVMTNMFLCDYQRHWYGYVQGDTKHQIVNFNNVSHTTSLVLRYDDIKLTLKDVFEKY